jgi:hypothetical protein
MDDSGCWLWSGALLPNGYGMFWFDSRSVYAHRLSWEFARGPIPQNMSVLHSCDVRACVNHQHLFLGTQLDNMRDASAKGRLNVPHPSRQKLSDSQVAEIFRLAATGVKQVRLAEQFGVSQPFISVLLSGKRRQRRKVAA